MTSILVIDDDPLIGRFIQRGLRAAGHAATVADNAAVGHAMAVSGAFDLVLLDLVLGDGDGFTILRDLRTRHNTLPVIVITGYPAQRDLVACLNGGANDYLVKPFRFDELLARIRVRLRASGAAPNLLVVGDLTLDLLTRRVTMNGRRVDLTAREFSLLEAFVRHPDQVLSRTQLASQVWGYSFDPTSNIVNVYIAALRRKIGDARIETVRGAGHRLLAVEPDPPVLHIAPDPPVPAQRVRAADPIHAGTVGPAL